MNYIGQNINGWIVTKSYIKNFNGRNRTFLEIECEICHKLREIRADKRKTIAKCGCSRVVKVAKNSSEKNYNFESHFEKEWQKIELCNIYTKEELSNILKKNSDYKIYRINSKFPYSENNIFIGSPKDFQEKRQMLKMKREYKIKQELLAIKQKNDNGRIKCPFCGRYSLYINACPYCKMSYITSNADSIYEPNNKKMIEYENETYTTLPGHFLIVQKDQKIFYPLKDIVARYTYQNDGISRIGLINVKEIDYYRQGLVGDFQAINSNKKNFIINDVFQYNKFAPFMFINYEVIDKEKISNINSNDIIHYAVLLAKKESKNFTLAIYKENLPIFSIENVINIWGHGYGKIYFKKNNNLDYYFDLQTLEIIESSSFGKITNLPEKMAFEYFSKKKHIEFYFNRGVFKNSVILYEILNSQYNVMPVKNEFADDDTLNYKVKIPLKDYNIQDIVSILIDKKSDGLTHFGYSYNIYGYPLFRILRDSIKEHKETVLGFVKYELKDFFNYIIDIANASTINTQNYKEIRNRLKEKYQCDDIELINLMINKYGIEQVFNLDYYYFNYRRERAPSNFYNEMFNEFYNSLPESKILWKSEYKLFLLVKNSYPDAIYQYRNPIFNGLIIDIYIPSLRIAIEYQGEQHYQAIERFSDNLLYERKKNDDLKRELCTANNIQLIHWKYDELISKLNLDIKINELNVKRE